MRAWGSLAFGEVMSVSYQNYSANELGIYTKRKQHSAEFASMVDQYISQGYTPYLVTITFNPISESKNNIISAMSREVTRLFSTWLNRMFRNPRSAVADRISPVLIGCFDLPVRKNEKKSIRDFHVNYGYHFHGILLVPEETRIKTSFSDHVSDNIELYEVRLRQVDKLHVEKITTDTARVVDYVFKSVTSGRISYDDGIVILPYRSIPG